MIEDFVDPSDVAELLARRDAQGLVARLVQTCHDNEQSDAIFRALIALGSESVPPLLEALQNAWEQALERVVEVLGQIGDERAIAPLIDLLIRTASEEDFFAGLINEPLLRRIERALTNWARWRSNRFCHFCDIRLKKSVRWQQRRWRKLVTPAPWMR